MGTMDGSTWSMPSHTKLIPSNEQTMVLTANEYERSCIFELRRNI